MFSEIGMTCLALRYCFRFYEDAVPTETLNREEVTDLNIRRHFSLIINGVSTKQDKTNRIYDGVEAETRKSQARFQII